MEILIYLCLLLLQSSEMTLGGLLIFFMLTTFMLLYLLIQHRRKDKIEKEKGEYQRFCLDILDHLPFPVFVKDINDGFKYKLWNKEAEIQSNTSRENMIDKDDFDIHGQERGHRYREVDETLVNSGKTHYRAEEDYITPDGVSHNTIVNKTIISRDNNNWLLIVRWEITQIKEYEKKLIKAKEDLENAVRNQNLVLNSINFGLVYVDKNYNVQWESTNNIEHLSKGRRYIPGKICYKTVMGRETPCMRCALTQV